MKQQQQAQEKKRQRELDDAAADAQRIKRVKDELRTTCMECGDIFQTRGQLMRHMHKYKHRLPAECWRQSEGAAKIGDLDALEVIGARRL